MPLSAGTRLGPYEILAPLGAGGMGEVYKARDTRLDRIVAIKVSHEKFSERCDREARAVASLNHPHICQLYDVGPDYLVMEFVEGTPLQGPLPLEKTIEYAAQILEALDAAHRKGITHRDLKPANILVSKSGIKLLDFGLAKQSGPFKEADSTLTAALTGEGQIVGTLQYMSPEQLQGKEADARSDLFSFGCVLYEMLTGKRAFDGQSAASVVAALLERPAPSVADVAPAALDRLLGRCLAKDPDQRWQNARDLMFELESIGDAPTTISRSARRAWLPWTVAAAGIAASLNAWLPTANPAKAPQRAVVRFTLDTSGLKGIAFPALSPDGSRIAFFANDDKGSRHLYFRPLDSNRNIVLADLDNDQTLYTQYSALAWSPDGRCLLYVGNGALLRKVDLTGGTPQVVAGPMPRIGRGFSWTSAGTILVATGGAPIALVTDKGGALVPWRRSSHEVTTPTLCRAGAFSCISPMKPVLLMLKCSLATSQTETRELWEKSEATWSTLRLGTFYTAWAARLSHSDSTQSR